MPTVHLLDYVAGNVRSLVNAIEKLGYTIEWVNSPTDIGHADVRGEDHTLNWALLKRLAVPERLIPCE